MRNNNEPQAEAFIPEYDTLKGITDARLAWISETAKNARELLDVQGIGVDCVQLGIWLNKNPSLKIKIKTVELPSSIDACTLYIPESDSNRIGLNRNRLRYPFRSSSDFRANFTIAHELGHILLKHATIPDSMKSDTLKEEEDTEADEFAGQFLMPENLLMKCNFRWPARIADYFKVSHTALWQRLNNLHKLGLLEPENKVPYQRCCEVCGNTNLNAMFPYQGYCSICGTLLDGKSWGVMPVKYTGYYSDRGKVMMCPRCGHNLNGFSGDTCPSCDLPRRNKCTNGKATITCFESDTSARYCNSCGSPTSFYSDRLLTDWWHAVSTGEMILREPIMKRRFVIR